MNSFRFKVADKIWDDVWAQTREQVGHFDWVVVWQTMIEEIDTSVLSDVLGQVEENGQ